MLVNKWLRIQKRNAKEQRHSWLFYLLGNFEVLLLHNFFSNSITSCRNQAMIRRPSLATKKSANNRRGSNEKTQTSKQKSKINKDKNKNKPSRQPSNNPILFEPLVATHVPSQDNIEIKYQSLSRKTPNSTIVRIDSNNSNNNRGRDKNIKGRSFSDSTNSNSHSNSESSRKTSGKADNRTRYWVVGFLIFFLQICTFSLYNFEFCKFQIFDNHQD